MKYQRIIIRKLYLNSHIGLIQKKDLHTRIRIRKWKKKINIKAEILIGKSQIIIRTEKNAINIWNIQSRKIENRHPKKIPPDSGFIVYSRDVKILLHLYCFGNTTSHARVSAMSKDSPIVPPSATCFHLHSYWLIVCETYSHEYS